MKANIARAKTIEHQKLDPAQLIRWVLPTVALEPFHEDAGLTLDDIIYKNKTKLAPASCQRLTDLVWPTFSESIRQGREVDVEEARTNLIAKDHSYLRGQYEHVVFRHSNNVFVAEYEVLGDAAEVLRCWKAPSSDIHPTTVFVTFKDVSEKESFDQLATDLGYRSQDLILALARDFTQKFANRSKVGTE